MVDADVPARLTIGAVSAMPEKGFLRGALEADLGERSTERIFAFGFFGALAAALISGAGTLLGSFLCARLSARIGRDIRNALYDKSLAFSAYDFEQFGTGSMITRTLNDVNIVQRAFVWTIQMVLPVPKMCIRDSPWPLLQRRYCKPAP